MARAVGHGEEVGLVNPFPLKSRDITLLTKVRIVNTVVFLVVVYGCESWTIRRLRAKELMLLNCGAGEDS